MIAVLASGNYNKKINQKVRLSGEHVCKQLLIRIHIQQFRSNNVIHLELSFWPPSNVCYVFTAFQLCFDLY